MSATNGSTKNLGMTGIHSLEICVHDATPWIPYLTEGFGFQLVARNTTEHQNETGTRQHMFRVADVRFILMESLTETSHVRRYLDRHPEGVLRVNYGVKDIDFTFTTLDSRGGTPTSNIESFNHGGGTWKRFAIATALGDVEYGFVQTDGDIDLPPGFEKAGDFDPSHNPLGITHVDHLTSNVRTLFPLISWYENVMGFQRFWDVEFHTDDIKPGVGSGLKSIVSWDPESGVKLANNEPLRPRFAESQIQIYVDDNRGPGIQHVAFGVKDILASVDHCNSKDITFLATPKTYYDAVPQRIKDQNMGDVKEDLGELEKRSILIDGEDGGYLLQIFCKEQAVQFQRPNAGPLFIEIIQRRGANGFGEGNFRALFESIEREQDETRAWKESARQEPASKD